MTAQSIITLNPKEAVQLLHSYGMSIGRERLCAGIRQGVFKFGDFIQMEGEEYIIYLALLERWIAKRLCEETIPEVPKEEATT